jgi:hypothetical protein
MQNSINCNMQNFKDGTKNNQLNNSMTTSCWIFGNNIQNINNGLKINN